MAPEKPKIRVEITDPFEFHCFRLVLVDREGREIEIMLHATQLVHLLHEGSKALCEWQHQTTNELLERIIG